MQLIQLRSVIQLLDIKLRAVYQNLDIKSFLICTVVTFFGTHRKKSIVVRSVDSVNVGIFVAKVFVLSN